MSIHTDQSCGTCSATARDVYCAYFSSFTDVVFLCGVFITKYILPGHNYDSATMLGSVGSCLDYISGRGDTAVRVCFEVCLSET